MNGELGHNAREARHRRPGGCDAVENLVERLGTVGLKLVETKIRQILRPET